MTRSYLHSFCTCLGLNINRNELLSYLDNILTPIPVHCQNLDGKLKL